MASIACANSPQRHMIAENQALINFFNGEKLRVFCNLIGYGMAISALVSILQKPQLIFCLRHFAWEKM